MFNVSLDNERDVHDDTRVSEQLRGAKPGDIVAFGIYLQTAEGTDRTPIRWRVLHHRGRELFLLSEYILDCKRYHAEYVDMTWRDCDLRRWLNREFYNAAFTTAQKQFIKTTLCADNGEGCPDTKDKVFLLSVSEAKGLTDKLTHSSSVWRRARGTEFSKVRKDDGCHLYVYDKTVRADYIVENGEAFGCSWWWLRTRGSSSSRAYFVGARSSIRSYCRVNRVSYGVRPALKLDLSRRNTLHHDL